MANEFEKIKHKRVLNYDELQRICRMTGWVTRGQACDIASAIISIQAGEESISDWYERFCKENEEFED